MPNFNSENGGMIYNVAITIPSNAGTGSKIRDLIAAGGYTFDDGFSIIIDANQPGATADVSRAAFTLAAPLPGLAIATTDFTARGKTISDGAEYYAPSVHSVDQFIRSTTGSTVSALVVVLT